MEHTKETTPGEVRSSEGLGGAAPTDAALDEATKLSEIALACTHACLMGLPVTLTVRGKMEPGFPRGSLLSVGTDGSKNYTFNPVRVLAWIYSRQQIAA